MNNNELKLIECPICHKKMKSLASHLPFIHNISCEEFKKIYPDFGRIQLDVRKKHSFKCEYCDRAFEYKNALQSHIKRVHPDFFKKEVIIKAEGKFECKICGKKTNALYNHVLQSHQMCWEEYCIQYNWDKNKRSFFTSEHYKNLSINKKEFYASEKGMIEKERLRKKYAGKNNPATRPEVRAKISAAASKRIENDENIFNYQNLGLKIIFYLGDVKYLTKSFLEFKTLYTLYKNGINFKYENIRIKYKNEDNIIVPYLLDLWINGYYIELKTNIERINYFKIHKYKEVNNILHKINRELLIMDYDGVCKKFNLIKPFNSEFYEFLKNELDNDRCKISYVCGKGRKSKILKNIDENYMNHRNIKIKEISNKNEICKD